jgi:hypothetical protein
MAERGRHALPFDALRLLMAFVKLGPLVLKAEVEWP